MERSFGRFVLENKLGEGGMGVVYAGHDTQLERRVAIKMVREVQDEEAARRLLREARAGASVSHPNICQVYEIGESEGELYVVMELLQGESLAARIDRGPLPVREAMEVVLQTLAGLEAIHERGLLHRDIKPSNVFLTSHGVKLLDFGLARVGPWGDSLAETRLTRSGQVMGTPHYMAPEQWRGEALGPAADLFAVGALFHETLTGRPAFPGETIVEVYEAVVRHAPPPLAGGGAVQAADRIVQRALEKRPDERYPSARAMADDVRNALDGVESTTTSAVRAIPRFIALPFRVLRSDPDTDFLAETLPEAVSGSLAGLNSLVVRSSRFLAGATTATADVKEIARHTDVDLVLAGTLMRSGDRIRVSAELIEAPSGTLLWSEATLVTMGDLFQLQDGLARQIVDSLAAPLRDRDTGRLPVGPPPREAAAKPISRDADVPANPSAYEAYLRGNQFVPTATQAEPLLAARERYRECLAADPDFAPAWARLARVHRILAKFDLHGDPQENYRLAREGFEKALALSPNLPIAHHHYTYLQVEAGEAVPAMVRLIGRAHESSTDPELFAGLVVACRFTGLFEASVAAHHRGRRLDPSLRTSVEFTYRMMCDYERARAADESHPSFLGPDTADAMGRSEEALASFREMMTKTVYEGWEATAGKLLIAGLEGDAAAARRAAKALEDSPFRDAEGIYTMLPYLARVVPEQAIEWLGRAVRMGLSVPFTLERDHRLDPLRQYPEFEAIHAEAEKAHREAVAAFRNAGGDRLLGVEVGE